MCAQCIFGHVADQREDGTCGGVSADVTCSLSPTTKNKHSNMCFFFYVPKLRIELTASTVKVNSVLELLLRVRSESSVNVDVSMAKL